MKKALIWLVASLLFTMVGCVEGLHESGITETSSEQLPDLTAGFAEGETKTYVESGKYLRWHEYDRLTAFNGNTLNRQYKFNGATGDNSGSFSYVPSGNLETGNALDRIYAVYPYDETTTITDDGKISLILPDVQIYAENSFGRCANTMLAATENVEDTFLGFKNACGYLKLKLYNADGATIKSIEVKGNGDEKIAGAATATIAFGEVPQLTMADDATTSITLDCGYGVTLGTTAEAATEFWVVIPETTFEGGITITVTDTEGGIFEKSTTKEVVIERNAIQPMAALEVEFVAPVAKSANNEIWYTNGSTTKATTPNRTDVFGANIVSNTYDAEKECWVIKFEGDVTMIGDQAFYFCEILTSVTIPDSVTSIGKSAFSMCSRLTSVTIPDRVTSIGDNAFFKCSSLNNVIIGNGVTSIGENAFSGCSSITSITIGNSVTSIGYRAFSNCTDLTSVTIPDSVTSIGEDAFYYCGNLTSVIIPDSVTEIGYRTFYNCRNLTSVTIGNSVTSIGYNAFDFCISLQEFKGKFASEDGRCLIIDGVLNSFAPAELTEYTIPDSVTTIGYNAFYGCPSLTSVTIPDSVTTIGYGAFYNCSSLNNVIIGNGVRSIGENAFNDCSSITSITIGNSVTSIGYNAFYGCSSITSVHISDITDWCNISFESYDANPLYNGASLYLNNELVTNLIIPNSVTVIGDGAFFGCSSLTSITIPDSVASIGWNAFYGCENLTSVTIPNSVTRIYWGAFSYCTSLESITIPNSVTMIEDSTFYGCENLTSITIPDSVTSIGWNAFYGCENLTSITIPDSVTEIKDRAFMNCSSLESVYCKATPPPSLESPYVFNNNASGRKIYVPMESVSEYKSASYWTDYAYAIVGYDF